MDKRKNAADQPAQSHERQLRFGSMMRKLLLPSGSRRWITPIVMLLLLLGIIAGAFIVSSVTQRHVQLDDGTVWITSLKDRKAARFNAKNKDVDAGGSSAASRFDVAQHDGDTVISEGTKASNIAASTISETGNTAIKTDIETIIGGNTAAFINTKTGNVWVGSAADVKSVNPTTDKPNMKLGSGGKIAVTHNGTVYGDRASDGAVLSIACRIVHRHRRNPGRGGKRHRVLAAGKRSHQPAGRYDAAGPFHGRQAKRMGGRGDTTRARNGEPQHQENL